MATAAQVNQIFFNAIKKPQPRRRTSPSARRQEIVDAQIAALEQAVVNIRRKVREVPAWAHGYNSAVTTIELQIADLKLHH